MYAGTTAVRAQGLTTEACRAIGLASAWTHDYDRGTYDRSVPLLLTAVLSLMAAASQHQCHLWHLGHIRTVGSTNTAHRRVRQQILKSPLGVLYPAVRVDVRL